MVRISDTIPCYIIVSAYAPSMEQQIRALPVGGATYPIGGFIVVINTPIPLTATGTYFDDAGIPRRDLPKGNPSFSRTLPQGRNVIRLRVFDLTLTPLETAGYPRYIPIIIKPFNYDYAETEDNNANLTSSTIGYLAATGQADRIRTAFRDDYDFFSDEELVKLARDLQLGTRNLRRPSVLVPSFSATPSDRGIFSLNRPTPVDFLPLVDGPTSQPSEDIYSLEHVGSVANDVSVRSAYLIRESNSVSNINWASNPNWSTTATVSGMSNPSNNAKLSLKNTAHPLLISFIVDTRTIGNKVNGDEVTSSDTTADVRLFAPFGSNTVPRIDVLRNINGTDYDGIRLVYSIWGSSTNQVPITKAQLDAAVTASGSPYVRVSFTIDRLRNLNGNVVRAAVGAYVNGQTISPGFVQAPTGVTLTAAQVAPDYSEAYCLYGDFNNDSMGPVTIIQLESISDYGSSNNPFNFLAHSALTPGFTNGDVDLKAIYSIHSDQPHTYNDYDKLSYPALDF